MSEPTSFAHNHPATVIRRRAAIMVFVNDTNTISIIQEEHLSDEPVCIEVMPEDIEALIGALRKAKDAASP